MTESELLTALSERYAPPAYALLEQVRNGTGWTRETRTADALVMSLWPSRGLELIGIEIKVSRSDWIKELKNPAKAEEIARFCHRWYVVVSDPKIVADGELPKTWGLLVPRGKKLIAKVEAPDLTPIPITTSFLAAIFRRLQAVVSPAARMEEVRKAAHAEGFELGKKETGHLREWISKDHDALKAALDRFEETSGIKIDRWTYGNIGEAVKVVVQSGLQRSDRKAEQIANQLRSLADQVEKVSAVLAEVKAP